MITQDHEPAEPARLDNSNERTWRKILKRWSESGLSQAEFCRRNGWRESEFSRWKIKLAKTDAQRNQSSKEVAAISRQESKESYWRQVLARFSSSGLSIEDFCAAEGIRAASLKWWRGEITRRDSEKRRRIVRPERLQSQIFVPVRIEGEKPAQVRVTEPRPIAEFDIVTGTVRIFETASGNSLLELLKLLKELVN